MRRKSTLRQYLESLLLSVVVVLFIRAFLGEAVQIPTGSMEDTLLPGDHLLINKFAFRFYEGQEPVRFLPFAEVVRKDVVVFKHLEASSEPAYYVKRVVVLPGETVEILEKQVFIDGAPLDEPYAVFKEPARRDLSPRDNYGAVTVPARHFFVLGDDRDRSYDSRFWRFLARDKIVGKPLFVWWSIDVARGRHSPIDFTDRLGGMFTRFFRDTRWSRTGKVIG